MIQFHRTNALLAFAALVLVPGPSQAARPADPLRFFEGRTESIGNMKVMLKAAYKMRSLGRGKIAPDGSLILIQRVEEEGKPVHERHWRIRKTGPRSYSGTMSEAKGPVSVDEIGGRYRFRFKLPGHLTVEQWVTPRPDWHSALNNVTIRKFGVLVATSDGMINRLGD
jgi:hypothetical protein